MTRSRALLITAGAVILGVAALAAQPSSGQSPEERPAPIPAATATVVRTDIVLTVEIDGVLGFGDTTPLPSPAKGTVTWLPELGSTIGFGEALFKLDEQPVILFEGDTPAFRALQTGISDGPDVLQLEQALTAVGVADETTLTVDDDFTSATSRAIKRWQELLEIDVTGRIDFGFVVFSPTPVRVAGHLVSLGEGAAGPVITTTGVSQSVFVELPADQQGLLTEQLPVSVELPNGTLLSGIVGHVASVARQTQPDRLAVIDIVVDVDQLSGTGLDEAPVEVIVTDRAASDILAVPISALLVLSEGGFAVELVAETGTELVNVETGAFGDGLVEVIGNLAEGQTVVVPT